jgi:hypothetical protein
MAILVFNATTHFAETEVRDRLYCRHLEVAEARNSKIRMISNFASFELRRGAQTLFRHGCGSQRSWKLTSTLGSSLAAIPVRAVLNAHLAPTWYPTWRTCHACILIDLHIDSSSKSLWQYLLRGSSRALRATSVPVLCQALSFSGCLLPTTVAHTHTLRRFSLAGKTW